MRRTWIILAGFIVIFTGILSAQEKPLTIDGTFSSGFYSAYTRGGGNENQNIDFVPGGAVFDLHGFYKTPDLLNISLQPELHAGPQASDAGLQGGNGFRTSVSLLRRSVFPLTFRYSNVQLTDAYFGSLSQVSSYTRSNRNKNLGLTSELRPAGLPTVIIDWGSSSVDSQSGITAIPDYISHSNHINLDTKYERWGWDFLGFARRQQQTSDLFSPAGQSGNLSFLRQNVRQYQGSARRALPWDSELSLDAGSQSTANLLLSQPIDLSTRYANANLRLFQRRKLKTSLRAGYTSNIASLLLAQLVGGLGSSGSLTPDAAVLLPFQHAISSLNVNSLSSLELPHGLGLYGSLDRTTVLTASDSQLSSSYFTTTGGITYAGKFRWGSLFGQYGHEFGIGSVTGQSGTIEGQNFSMKAQHGTLDGLELDFSVIGRVQGIRNAQPADDHSFASEGSVARRLFGQVSGRVGGGWQEGTFTIAGSAFHTQGYTVHGGFEHPRFQLSGSLNTSLGNSLQAYSQLFGGIAAQSALLSPIQLSQSDLRGIALSLHTNPIGKLELAALWTRSIQHLEGLVANDFAIMDVHAAYHFRKLAFELGSFRSTQLFASYLATYPETQRGRFYFRVSRTVKFL